MRTYESFDAAKADLGPEMVVSCAMKGDEPVYFNVPSDADDDYMREHAFAAIRPEPMSDYQKYMIEQAKQAR